MQDGLAVLCVVLALTLFFQQRRVEALEQAAQTYDALRNECDTLRMELDSVKADLRETLEREMELEEELRTRPTAGGQAAAYAVDVRRDPLCPPLPYGAAAGPAEQVERRRGV